MTKEEAVKKFHAHIEQGQQELWPRHYFIYEVTGLWEGGAYLKVNFWDGFPNPDPVVRTEMWEVTRKRVTRISQ